ncbi:hypothetical protein C7C46_29170 [Streptomyces tateyamensis]|uniref:Uncharacterized protein n=1 Tax=Streptomyces tateyamensis TaxID=565073 RepID=A0A2V4N622_9ACTN|nr:hypothetical protein C7C46_29170 [Streptomyces tateyamensis]
MLGFWVTPEDQTLPNPADLVDDAWDESERQWVAEYLNRGQFAGGWMGSSRCRICSRVNGYRDFTDGFYLWPEGLAHYVLDHAVRLPTEFFEHISQRHEALEELERDISWWRQNAANT